MTRGEWLRKVFRVSYRDGRCMLETASEDRGQLTPYEALSIACLVLKGAFSSVPYDRYGDSLKEESKERIFKALRLTREGRSVGICGTPRPDIEMIICIASPMKVISMKAEGSVAPREFTDYALAVTVSLLPLIAAYENSDMVTSWLRAAIMRRSDDLHYSFRAYQHTLADVLAEERGSAADSIENADGE